MGFLCRLPTHTHTHRGHSSTGAIRRHGEARPGAPDKRARGAAETPADDSDASAPAAISALRTMQHEAFYRNGGGMSLSQDSEDEERPEPRAISWEEAQQAASASDARRAADLAAVSGYRTVQCHVLRLERHDGDTLALEPATQRGHQGALAGIGGCALNHQGAHALNA